MNTKTSKTFHKKRINSLNEVLKRLKETIEIQKTKFAKADHEGRLYGASRELAEVQSHIKIIKAGLAAYKKK